MAGEPRWRTLPDGRTVRNVAHAQVESAGDEAMVAEYTDMTKEDLGAELERRGLAKSGNKDDLVARLQESDAS